MIYKQYMSYLYSIITNIPDNLLASFKVARDKTYDVINLDNLQRVDSHLSGETNKIERMYPKNGLINDYLIFFGDPTLIYPNLYLGSAYNSASYKLLKRLNIKYIVNVSSEITNYFPDDFVYYRINIRDDNTESIQKYFNDSYVHIDRFLEENNGAVLIHCYMGASRSATIVANYVSTKSGKDITVVLNDLIKKRPIVNPTRQLVKDLILDKT